MVPVEVEAAEVLVGGLSSVASLSEVAESACITFFLVLQFCSK